MHNENVFICLLSVGANIVKRRILINLFAFIFCFVSVFNASGSAAENAKADFSHLSDLSLTFTLPVNVAVKPKTVLLITQPKGFYTTPEMLGLFSKRASEALAFVPKGESFEGWSKIFTLHSMVGGRISAEQVAHIFAKKLAAGTKRSLVVFSSKNNETFFNCSDVSVAIQYVTQENIVAIIYFNYFSGPYDCSGFQYTEKLNSWLEPDKAKEKVAQIQAEFKSAVKILQVDNDLLPPKS